MKTIHQQRETLLAICVIGLVTFLSTNAFQIQPTNPFFAPRTIPHRVAPFSATTSSGDMSFLDDTIQQRNLRYSGVARLYSSNTTNINDASQNILKRLQQATVLVVGLGGVGSWAAEALCRSGIGHLILIDLDDICISNTNRQLHTTSSTVGKLKIDEMARRLSDIDPTIQVSLVHDFVSPNNVHDILSTLSANQTITTCLDATDGSSGKSALIAACARQGIPIVTCGGSAGRMDPSAFVCDDLSHVKGDSLLRACRRTLRKKYGFEEGRPLWRTEKAAKARKWNIKAVYSLEPQRTISQNNNDSSMRRCDGALGTACFVTGTCGFLAAAEVVAQIARDEMNVPRQFFGEKGVGTTR